MTENLLPGDPVCESEGYIRGHGTVISDDMIKSLYFGKMKQINKLITVEPHYSFKYTPEIGDVIIGRVNMIFNKKWRLEANSKTDTTLSLSAINLPGVMQRRKSEEDEMNMRNFFDIKDLIVCEVQKVNKNGSASLHTRNDKYRKLENGVLVIVPHYLIQNLKSRFLKKNDIEIIVGCNGFIWISPTKADSQIFEKVSILYNTFKGLGSSQAVIDVERIFQEIA